MSEHWAEGLTYSVLYTMWTTDWQMPLQAKCEFCFIMKISPNIFHTMLCQDFLFCILLNQRSHLNLTVLGMCKSTHAVLSFYQLKFFQTVSQCWIFLSLLRRWFQNNVLVRNKVCFDQCYMQSSIQNYISTMLFFRIGGINTSTIINNTRKLYLTKIWKTKTWSCVADYVFNPVLSLEPTG